MTEGTFIQTPVHYDHLPAPVMPHRVHGIERLFVVDGSVLPRSGRVNPSFTIYAWALRLADLIVRCHLSKRTTY
jgi:choline dehydrogenase-like flavoprotein